MSEALATKLGAIERRAKSIERLRVENERELAALGLVGRRVNAMGGGGTGLYEITEVRLSWDSRVGTKGRKVKADGKLGSQTWELGAFRLRMLAPGKAVER